MFHGRVIPENVFKLNELFHHRGKRNVLGADNGAVQTAGILLREKTFWNNDEQINVQANSRNRDTQHERLMGKDPAQAAAHTRRAAS